jgi:Icc-related predicted phosphoesterase
LPDKPLGVVRIAIVSDTHERHDLVKLPSGADVLLHCGDILMSSGLCHHSRGTRVLKQFNDWLEGLDIPEKVVIGGNHDSALRNLGSREAKDVLSSAELLHDSSVYLPRSRLRVYGNSHSLGVSHNKAWQGPVQLQSDAANFADIAVAPDAAEDTSKLAAKDPIVIVTPEAVKDADIVVTHLRSDDLQKLILEKAGAKPKVWASGHVHTKHGVEHACGTLFVNAAILDEHHNPWQPPVVVDLRHAM